MYFEVVSCENNTDRIFANQNHTVVCRRDGWMGIAPKWPSSSSMTKHRMGMPATRVIYDSSDYLVRFQSCMFRDWNHQYLFDSQPWDQNRRPLVWWLPWRFYSVPVNSLQLEIVTFARNNCPRITWITWVQASKFLFSTATVQFAKSNFHSMCFSSKALWHCLQAPFDK